MTISVLVVDDVPGAAKDFARAIEAEVGLECIAARSGPEALEMVKAHTIRVAVLDQRLDAAMDGIGLFKELRELQPGVRGIMVTAEAGRDEIAEALRQGFDDILWKADILALPKRVLQQYMKYCAESVVGVAAENDIIMRKRRWSSLRGGLTFYLWRIEVVRVNVALPSTWRTVRHIHAGEKLSVEEEYQVQASITHSTSNENEMRAGLELSASDLSVFRSKLEARIVDRIGLEVKEVGRRRWKVKREYYLAEPTDPGTVHVTARQYQWAPLVDEVRCVVIIECEGCRRKDPRQLSLYVPKMVIATRHVDHLSDRTEVVIPTGLLQLG